MYRLLQRKLHLGAFLVAVAVVSSGCTSFRDYFRNGFKVGPNYCPPQAPVAMHWIDADKVRQPADTESLSRWWTVFNDPKLNYLILCAYRQNLSVREAGFRILQARAQLAIAAGNLFPQNQQANGSYNRVGSAVDPAAAVVLGRYSDQWNYGFNLNWELDFWGRFRRAVAAADANLDASVEGYDAVLVTLFGDIAQNYVRVRTDQERIRLLRANVELQRGILDYIEKRFRVGKVNVLDKDQAEATLRQTEAGIPLMELDQRQAENALCTLMGMPPGDLSNLLTDGPIPTCPPEVAVGIPADLLRRRPDVRQAERLAASQAEQIGIAEADLYPAFYINGTMGYQAQNFPDLFRQTAFHGSVGPSFQWNLLNYGRIVNNVRLQDARFQELAVTYQRKVLTAGQEVEDGLATFLWSQRRTRLLDESVAAARHAVKIVIIQYETGTVDFNRYALITQNLVTQQDSAAQAKGQIAQGLIAMYRALGGGWEIRLGNNAALMEAVTALPPPEAEAVPAPPAAPMQPNGS